MSEPSTSHEPSRRRAALAGVAVVWIGSAAFAYATDWSIDSFAPAVAWLVTSGATIAIATWAVLRRRGRFELAPTLAIAAVGPLLAVSLGTSVWSSAPPVAIPLAIAAAAGLISGTARMPGAPALVALAAGLWSVNVAGVASEGRRSIAGERSDPCAAFSGMDYIGCGGPAPDAGSWGLAVVIAGILLATVQAGISAIAIRSLRDSRAAP